MYLSVVPFLRKHGLSFLYDKTQMLSECFDLPREFVNACVIAERRPIPYQRGPANLGEASVPPEWDRP